MSVPTSFSRAPPPDRRVAYGEGKWWGVLLMGNDGADKANKPYACALACGMTWGPKTANAYKVAGHIVGDINEVKFCRKATDGDKALAKSKRLKQPSPAPEMPDPKRARAEFAAGIGGAAAASSAGSSTAAPQPTTPGAADEAAAVDEEIREAGLKGMFRHMNSKAECEKLDKVWAQALAHAGLPPRVIENEYIRAAILKTSLAVAPYTPPKRQVFDVRLLPTIDAELSDELRLLLQVAPARTLMFDGWEEIINFILSSPSGDEFIGDVDLSGVEKTAEVLSEIAFDKLVHVQTRYGYSKEHRRPTTMGIVTDNPTTMRATRDELIRLATKPESVLYQPYLFEWPCFLHAINSLLGDLCSLPFPKCNLDSHKLVVRKVRKRPWLRAKLLEQQKARPDAFRDRRGRFRPLTVKRHGDTRMGSVPLSAARNIKLRHALDGVASLPEYNAKCGIKKAAAAGGKAPMSAADNGASEAESEDSGDEAAPKAKDKAEKEKSSNDCLKVKELVRSEDFWDDSAEVQAVLKGVLVTLRFGDMQRSLMGFIWPMMFTLERSFTKLASDDYSGGRMPLGERQQALQYVKDRWVYLHRPIHSLAYVLNPRFVGMDHFSDEEVKEDVENVLIEMLPTLDDVSNALEEYHEYHKKQGPWANKPLLWLRASKVSPADFWLQEAPKRKYLNELGGSALSLAHAAGGAERNFQTHGLIFSDLRKSTSSATLERLVRLYRNMRLRDAVLARGPDAKKKEQAEPKAYPLESGNWSSCDDSDDESAWDSATAPYGFGNDDRRSRST